MQKEPPNHRYYAKCDWRYDANAFEVVGIEGIKKESDASGKVYEQGSEAQATSDSNINIADVLNLVKQRCSGYFSKVWQVFRPNSGE